MRWSDNPEEVGIIYSPEIQHRLLVMEIEDFQHAENPKDFHHMLKIQRQSKDNANFIGIIKQSRTYVLSEMRRRNNENADCIFSVPKIHQYFPVPRTSRADACPRWSYNADVPEGHKNASECVIGIIYKSEE